MICCIRSAFGSHVAEKVLAGLHHQADQLDDDLSQQLESLLAGGEADARCYFGFVTQHTPLDMMFVECSCIEACHLTGKRYGMRSIPGDSLREQ